MGRAAAALRLESLPPTMLQTARQRVRITQDEDYEAQYLARNLARVTVELRNGTACSREVGLSGIRRHLTPSDADIEPRFRMIATPVPGRTKTEAATALAWRLETLRDLSELLQALQP